MKNIGLNAKVCSKTVGGTTTYYLRFKSDKSSKERFFNYLSYAKFYDKAVRILPHKFDHSISRTNLIEELKNSKAEYFQTESQLNWNDL